MLNVVRENLSKNFFADNMYKLESKREERRRQAEFISLIESTKEELRNARSNFNYTTDETLLEYYIYEIKAAETKLSYYLRRAKDEQVCNTDLASTILTDREGERSVAL